MIEANNGVRGLNLALYLLHSKQCHATFLSGLKASAKAKVSKGQINCACDTECVLYACRML